MEKSLFMRACSEGGAAIDRALRELDRSFFASLYRDGMRTLRDPDQARDLVQETFIKVWQRCATFRGDSELLPWIRAILRNGALERLRQPLREVPMDNDEGLTPEAARSIAQLSIDDDLTQERAMAQKQLAECFRVGWARFLANDPFHANVLGWIVEDELSIDDVAELLGRTPGATREFVSQCRKQARIYLTEWYAFARELKSL
jgi:RNA polymerase sigma-70 factor (ECF subfamily)